MYTYNPSTQEVEDEYQDFNIILSYLVTHGQTGLHESVSKKEMEERRKEGIEGRKEEKRFSVTEAW